MFALKRTMRYNSMHWSLVPFQIKGVVRHFVADFTGYLGMNLFDVIFQAAFWRHFTTANITRKLATIPMFHNKMFPFPGIRCKCFVTPVTWPPFLIAWPQWWMVSVDFFSSFYFLYIYDQSIASTKTKYIKLNIKTV